MEWRIALAGILASVALFAADPICDGLLAAIELAPGERVRRLVWADALEEASDVRHHLVRTQEQLAALSPTDPAANAAVLREQRLLRENGADWTVERTVAGTPVRILRGYSDILTLDAAAFLANGAAILGAEPLVEGLVLRNVTRELWGRILADATLRPLVTRLTSLELAGNLGRENFMHAFPPRISFPRLRHLGLRGDLNDTAMTATLIVNGRFPALRSLDLRNNGLHRAMNLVQMFGPGMPLRDVVALDLRGNSLDAEDAATLAGLWPSERGFLATPP